MLCERAGVQAAQHQFPEEERIAAGEGPQGMQGGTSNLRAQGCFHQLLQLRPGECLKLDALNQLVLPQADHPIRSRPFTAHRAHHENTAVGCQMMHQGL